MDTETHAADQAGQMKAEHLYELVPLAATLGIEPLHADKERVVLRLPYDARLCTAGGVMHGGALMSLADTSGALLAFMLLPEGAGGTTTVQSTTNFIRAVRGGAATVTTTPLHAGRRTIVVESEVRDDEGRLVVKTTQTQAVL
jgi:1,4-dihydroxy-2-naphthoyl-CoA hydrolase